MLKILLADDEHLEREALKIIINRNIKEALIVGEAENSKRAIELCEELKPDIVFMDIKMPGIDGIEASKIIKEKNNDIVIIVLTAYNDFEFAHRSIKAHVDDYILKPARPEVIINCINKHIKRIEKERNYFEELVNKLVKEIERMHYSNSKKALENIIMNLKDYCGKNNMLFIKKGIELANIIMFTASNMDLEIEDTIVNKLNNSDLINSLDYCYYLENELYNLLDNIFDVIIKEKPQGINELDAVLNYIEKYFKKGISLEEVANYANLSVHYLSKLFKKEVGINFVNYVTERKIEEAKKLLEMTDIPILNISLELSFKEQNYFSKVFKKLVGMTPTQYRDKKRREKEKKIKNNLMTRNTILLNGKWYI